MDGRAVGVTSAPSRDGVRFTPRRRVMRPSRRAGGGRPDRRADRGDRVLRSVGRRTRWTISGTGRAGATHQGRPDPEMLCFGRAAAARWPSPSATLAARLRGADRRGPAHARHALPVRVRPGHAGTLASGSHPPSRYRPVGSCLTQLVIELAAGRVAFRARDAARPPAASAAALLRGVCVAGQPRDRLTRARRPPAGSPRRARPGIIRCCSSTAWSAGWASAALRREARQPVDRCRGFRAATGPRPNRLGASRDDGNVGSTFDGPGRNGRGCEWSCETRI